jgi:hypothetical protein
MYMGCQGWDFLPSRYPQKAILFLRRSTVILTLMILNPALLAGCRSHDCDDRYEDCTRSGGASGMVYHSGSSTGAFYHSGGGGGFHVIGTVAHSSDTVRGGFGSIGGAHGFGE